MKCKHKVYDEEDQEWYSTLSIVFLDDGSMYHQCKQCGLTILPGALEQNRQVADNEEQPGSD